MEQKLDGMIEKGFLKFSKVFNRLLKERVTVVIPAYNEEKSIAKVVKTAKDIPMVDDVLVVDDGSKDATAKSAEEAGAKVIRHEKNQGKGAAMRTGIENAHAEIILFLDADLENITPEKITKLITPVANGSADFVKASFELKRGRVTELVVKPLLKVLYPSKEFKQPISGQFCARRDFLQKTQIRQDWGIDISMLLDAIRNGQRIKEIDIGELIHKARTLDEKAEMAEDIIRATLEKAGLLSHKYKLIAFDLDETLLDASTLASIIKSWHLEKQRNRLERVRKKITAKEFLKRLGGLFSGRSIADFRRECARIPLMPYAKETISALKQRGMKVVLITHSFSPIADYFAEILGIEGVIAPKLFDKSGIVTGWVEYRGYKHRGCSDRLCKGAALRRIAKELKIPLEQTIAVGNNKHDICMLKEVGLPVVVSRYADKEVQYIAKARIDSLAELLLLAE